MDKRGFLQLIDKYLSGNASDEEERQLYYLLESFQDTNTWDERGMDVKDELEKKMLARLLGAVNLSTTNKPANIFVLPVWARIAAAAVILFVSAGSFYFYSLTKSNSELVLGSPVNQIGTHEKAGEAKVFLTLSNGTIIYLDNADDGLLAKEGNTSIRKLRHGQLEYHNDNKLSKLTKDNVVELYNTITTPKGSQYKLILPDGTKVWLNAASSFRFPASFTGKERSTVLNGEAYFEVAKNEEMPFNVVTGEKQVTVLGTHFNIRAYQDEDNYEASLLEGSIRVSATSTTSAAKSKSPLKLLQPGQQARISNTNATGINLIGNIDTTAVIAWKEGLFLFNNTSIRNVMQQISHWYNMDINYEGEMPQINFTGIMPRTDHVSVVLKTLQSAGGVKFSIEGKKIIVRRN